MVDTINTTPNDDKPLGNNQHFYSGFNKPEDVTVNLASEHKGVENPPQPVVEEKPSLAGEASSPSMTKKEAIVAPDMTPVSNVISTPKAPQATMQQEPSRKVADLEEKPKPNYQTTYAHTVQREPIMWGKLLFVFVSGVLIALLISVGSYFVVGYLNQNKLNTQNEQLNEIKDKLQELNQASAPLSMPETTPPVSSAPAVETPAVEAEPVEQPAVQVPAPSTPPTQPDGGQDAQG